MQALSVKEFHSFNKDLLCEKQYTSFNGNEANMNAHIPTDQLDNLDI